ncbi:MAG: alanine--tRNA ligase [Methanonatronarchaeia archaeon]|nr:MAG: alanine--tRNA ligase [Methanonatronarchaeia archaeon]
MTLEDEYKLDFLQDQDFIRKKCVECGYYFWTLEEGRDTCGDPPCDDYSFINNPPIQGDFDLTGMREHFLSFFEDRMHERVDRRPVIARWRDDIFLTIASIADFQPHVTGGHSEPPANPLTVSQPCIRLDDIDSVGRSGRHLTNFEMMAHHAFNFGDEHTYWKDKTVELCHELFTGLGIDGGEIIYKENPWAGGGNAGPAFEVLCRGLELATLVFMNMELDPNGDYEIKGDRYSKMDRRIVDTGYGLERMVWASEGSPTIYDAVFPEVVKKVVEYAGIDHQLKDPEYREVLGEHARLSGYMDVELGSDLKEIRKKVASRMDMDVETLKELMEPIEEAYAVVDHTRTITFMLGDGIVPSNVKAGYLARHVIRRALRMMMSLEIEESLSDIVQIHIDNLENDYPEFKRREDIIREIVDLEEKRFEETVSKGKNLVRKTARHHQEKDEKLPLESVMELYDTHGVPPEITQEVGRDIGVEVEFPDDFYTRVAKKHEGEKKEVKETSELEERLEDHPATKLLYYSQPDDISFEGVIIDSFDNKIILDQTLFYPEGGGQPADVGTVDTGERIYEITDVQKIGDVVVHTYKDENDEGTDIKKGVVVQGKIDQERRKAHARHHTATHVVLGAARDVLGYHVFQQGSNLSTEQARLDISHYKSITPEEIREIEWKVNKLVMDNRSVSTQYMDRNEAEKKYGYVLYQGGVPMGNEIRVVETEDWNVQACGGTHCENTGKIGPVKILSTESVQDGVIRLNFSAGEAAIKSMHERDRILQETAEVFSVHHKELPKTAERFFSEWKERGKEIERLQKEIAKLRQKQLETDSDVVNGIRIASKKLTEAEMSEVRATAVETSEEGVTTLIAGDRGHTAISLSKDAVEKQLNADRLFSLVAETYGGGGGGNKETAQGRIPPEKVDDAVENFDKIIKQALP